MFEPISKIIRERINRFSFRKEVVPAEVRQDWFEIVKKLFGKEAAESTAPFSFRDGILAVKAANASLVEGLQSKKEEILVLLNKKNGRNLVEKIIFRT